MFKLKKNNSAEKLKTLKNILFNIKLNLFLISNKKLSPEKEKELTEKISLNVEKAIDFLNDYLELEEYKKEKSLNIEEINIGELIENIVREIQYKIEEKKTNIYLIKKNIYIKTNKKWLKKVLTNLLTNLIKYNEKTDFSIYFNKDKKQCVITIKENLSENLKKDFQELDLLTTVIRDLGGKIYFNENNIQIYLPKISKKIKIQKLIIAISSIILISSLVINYLFCFFPQKIKYYQNNNLKIAIFENGVFLKSYKNNKYEIKAYKNLFNSKFKTEIKITKGDLYLNTNNQKVTILTPKLTITNLGTKFETNVTKNISVSVFQGKIKAKKYIVSQNEGLIVSNKLKIEHLPRKVEKILVKSNKKIKLIIQSNYTHFRINLIKDNNLSTIKEIITHKKVLTIDNLEDGKWTGTIQAIKNNLYSPFKKFTFVSLINYYKALEYYKNSKIKLAKKLLQKSLKTINNASYKPYYLYGLILLNENNNNAYKYIKKSFSIEKNVNTSYLMALYFYKQKEFKKALSFIPKNTDNTEIKLLLAKIYINLKQIKEAKNILYHILEKRDNKEAKKILLKLKPKFIIEGN